MKNLILGLAKHVVALFVIVAVSQSSLGASEYDTADIEWYGIDSVSAAPTTRVIIKLSGISEVQHLILARSSLIADTEADSSVDLSKLAVLAGTLQNVDDSWVRLVIAENFVHGIIGTGEQRLEISSTDSTVFLADYFDTYSAQEQFSKSRQVFPTNTLSSGKAFSRVLRIGLVVDHLYNDFYDGKGVARSISIANGVDGIFREELGIAVKLDVAILTTDESFSRQPGASPSQLNSFVDFRKRTSELQGDIALVHLFSGSALPQTSWAGIGYAYIGTTCSSVGHDVSVSAPYYRGVELAAHEIAHNLGAYHDQDTASCAADTSKLMDLTIDGATKLSSCSIDLINADLARTACFEEVHDARITLQRSGSEDVIFKATSSSSFTTPISPEITIAHEATARNLPAFCRQRSADTIICTPAFFAPNQPYQFSIRFDNSVSNEISAEIAEAATFDPKLDNNIARIVIPANSNSVVTAICVDHDGDGYGWNGTGTCIPVNTVEPPVTTPSIVDRRTGSAIDLNNDKWVLSDLANRTIECRSYYFSSGQNQYLVDDTSYTRYLHRADNSGNGGSVQIARYVRGSNQQFTASSIRTADWSVEEGQYSGPAPFSRSPWVQLVGVGSGQDNAIRSYASDSSFDLCTAFPNTGDRFAPSGALENATGAGACLDSPPLNDGWGWNGVRSCRIPAESIVQTQNTPTPTSPAVVIKTVSAPLLDGQVTGSEWGQASQYDVSGQGLSLPVAIAGIRSERGADQWRIGHNNQYIFINATVPDATPRNDSTLYQNDDSMEIFIDGGNQRSDIYDTDDSHFIFRDTGEISGTFRPGIVVSHVRRYDTAAQAYHYEIQIAKNFLLIHNGEFGLDIQVNNDQNGGERDAKWGWSGTRGRNVHWYTMKNIGSACFDTGPLSTRCSGNTTTISAPCVDTGAIGDGWGWNGSTSCRVTSTSRCIDTGVIGDGWGWDGTRSCRL